MYQRTNLAFEISNQAQVLTKKIVSTTGRLTGRLTILPRDSVQGRVIGLPVNASELKGMAAELVRRARREEPGYVCVANVHMLVSAKQDPALRSVLEEASVVTSDGMPLVWALKHRGFSEAERVSGPDLMPALCSLAEKEKLSVYFYGGSPEAIETLREVIRERYPKLAIAGMESPPLFPTVPPLDEATIERIRASGAKFVFVGLGCPKQEFWMQTYSPHLPAILIGFGAAFDFLSGQKPRAPIWMQRHGLEWLHRFFSEPKRLWRRYLITNTLFFGYFLLDSFVCSLKKPIRFLLAQPAFSWKRP